MKIVFFEEVSLFESCSRFTTVMAVGDINTGLKAFKIENEANSKNQSNHRRILG